MATGGHLSLDVWWNQGVPVEALNAMVNASVDCIKLISLDGKILHMNRSGCIALNVSPDEKEFGMPWLDLLPSEIRSRGRRALRKARTGSKARFAGMSLLPGQEPIYWDNILTPMLDTEGSTFAILCVSRDVTSEVASECRLRRANEKDHLTGLLNRRAFLKKLHREVKNVRATDGKCGLLMIDLDYFKHVNDTLGHAGGDHLLKVLSKRIKKCLPHGACAARLGGDEFAVFVSNIQCRAELGVVAGTILRQLREEIVFAGQKINGGMSIGGAFFPEHGRDVSSLLKAADIALGALKTDGRGGFQFFSDRKLALAKSKANQLMIARRLHSRAIEPFYQPRIRMSDGKVVGMEALLRWKGADQKFHAAGEIEQAFQDYELSTRIANAMHEKVLTAIRKWLDRGLSVVPISINASPVEFFRNDYSERLLEKLEVFGVPASLMEVEVTEHMLVDRGSEYVRRALDNLKVAGIATALDDFGTGHSSLVHLRDYPIDIIKVDKSFVRRILLDPSLLAIVETICALGPKLSMEVVAEGVENSAQAKVLSLAGCTYGQGYFYNQPAPKETAETWLANPAPRFLVS